MKKLPPARRVLILLPRRAELKALGRVYKRTARNLRAIVDANLGDRFRTGEDQAMHGEGEQK